MRVVILQHQDYANYGSNLAQSLKSVGYDCDSYCLTQHSFKYKIPSIQTSERDIKIQIEKADLIIVCHSCGTMWDLVKDSGKRIWVFHTGTRYRTNPEKHNERWNGLAEKIFIALGEFETLGALNPIYIGITVDVKQVEPNFYKGGKLTIGHFPSNSDVKGTEDIVSQINILKAKHKDKFNWSFSSRIVSHSKQLQRMNECDIYVEMCASQQGGNPYGSYGTTAIEAAAMGKIVITNMLWQKLYNKYYPKDCLLICNTPKELLEDLEQLILADENAIKFMQKNTYNWVCGTHSFEATGNRLKHYING